MARRLSKTAGVILIGKDAVMEVAEAGLKRPSLALHDFDTGLLNPFVHA